MLDIYIENIEKIENVENIWYFRYFRKYHDISNPVRSVARFLRDSWACCTTCRRRNKLDVSANVSDDYMCPSVRPSVRPVFVSRVSPARNYSLESAVRRSEFYKLTSTHTTQYPEVRQPSCIAFTSHVTYYDATWLWQCSPGRFTYR